jgi:flagellar motor component MotA
MTSSFTSAPSPSDEDHRLIKGMVVRTLLLDVLERDILTLDTLLLKMPEVYILSLTRIQNEVLKEMLELRKQMRNRGVKVLEEARGKEGIETVYLCRGYRQQFYMLWTFARNEVKKELSRHLQMDLTQT